MTTFFLRARLGVTHALLSTLMTLVGFTAGTAANADDSCQLQYPVVLSHHFGFRKICPDDWTVAECQTREADAIARYCADWNPETGCAQWLLPADERHLPPRKINQYDNNLERPNAVHGYHRYYSKAIVDRIQACGNPVFIADKPPFASYQVRAASLRRTVLEALQTTGAGKVVIIGLSQGVQDARYMVAQLPVDDTNLQAGMMRDKVAAVVGTAGEHKGAESASLALSTAYTSNYLSGAGWDDPVAGDSIWSFEGGEPEMDDLLWRDRGNASSDEELIARPAVLTEGYDSADPDQYALDSRHKFRNYLHAVTNLSSAYMNDSAVFDPIAWYLLRQTLGISENGWSDNVNVVNEACNGVQYLSYAAKVRNWDEDYWGDSLIYTAVTLLYGANDGYATVETQRFDLVGYGYCADGKRNFRHVRTLDGSFWSHGYNHIFFTGRNRFDGPTTSSLQESAPYKGDAADFYQQVLRDLRSAGL